MNKTEFDVKIQKLRATIDKAYSEIERLTFDFRLTCTHPKRNITLTANSYEDEYGARVPEWDTFSYKCERCNTHVTLPKKPNSMKELRTLINNEI